MSLKGENTLKNVYNFFIKRFFRLYPTYWFAILFIVMFSYLLQGYNEYTIKQIIINFTMMQDIFKTSSIDGVFWTLMIELKFYILTLILFYFNILKYIKCIVLLLLLLSSATLCYGYVYQTGTYLGNGLWANLMLMYLGTAFYFYFSNTLSKKTMIYLVAFVISYFLFNYSYLPVTVYGDKFGYSVATILAIFIFIVALKYKKQLSSITTFFGNISYSFYLIHQVLGYIIISKFIDINTPFSQLITILLLGFLSVLIHKFIEKPSNKLGHKFVK